MNWSLAAVAFVSAQEPVREDDNADGFHAAASSASRRKTRVEVFEVRILVLEAGHIEDALVAEHSDPDFGSASVLSKDSLIDKAFYDESRSSDRRRQKEHRGTRAQSRA